MITRREALKTTALVAAAASLNPTGSALGQATAAGPYVVPPLPYAFDALEPHIDARTMEIHHDKHHAAYVTNLNKAVAEFPDLGKKTVEELLQGLESVPEKVRMAVRNQGGGHYNHSLFWQMMKKSGGGEPQGDLAKAITGKFASFAAFKDQFTKAALGQFGSGWAWLVQENKELKIYPAPNQDSPIFPGASVLPALDVAGHPEHL